MISVLLVSLAVPHPAGADGIRNPFQGAAAIGQGNAFAAQADDPTAVFYNPAGMTQLPGIQHTVGMQFVNAHTRFTSPTGVTTQNDRPFPIGLPPPGQLFLTANLGDLGVPRLRDLTIGLGIQNLFGFAAQYPQDAPFASAVTFAQLPLIAIKPTLAYKVTNRLSVGLGADILTFASFIGEGQLEQRFIWPGGAGLPPGANIELNGKGTTAGMNASVLYTLWETDEGTPRANLAFVWRSQAVLPLSGEFLADGRLVAHTTSSIRFPEIYTAGLALWPVRTQKREWKLEVDMDYARWQSIRGFDLHLSTGETLANPQSWRNAVTVGVGSEYRWLSLPDHPDWNVAMRVGYQHSERAVSNASFNPAMPDSNVHVLSVGWGAFCQGRGKFLGLVQCGQEEGSVLKSKAIGIDLAYQAFLFEPRTVAGNVNPTVDGIYRTTTHAGSVTMRINF